VEKSKFRESRFASSSHVDASTRHWSPSGDLLSQSFPSRLRVSRFENNVVLGWLSSGAAETWQVHLQNLAGDTLKSTFTNHNFVSHKGTTSKSGRRQPQIYIYKSQIFLPRRTTSKSGQRQPQRLLRTLSGFNGAGSGRLSSGPCEVLKCCA
jgi:hypothetical protein